MELQAVLKIEIAQDFGSFQENEKRIRTAAFASATELMRRMFCYFEAAYIAGHQVQV